MNHSFRSSFRAVDVDALLGTAAERNLSVELHARLADESESVLVARSRVLVLGEKEVLLDRPQAIGRHVVLEAGQVIDVYVGLDGELYRFTARISRPQFIVELRERKTLIGMAIERPVRAAAAQRRNHFRVLLAAMEPICVTLHDGAHEPIGSAPLDAARYAGELVDLSMGGASVRVNDHPTGSLQINDRLYCAFTLPQEASETIVLSHVRQRRSIADTSALRIGLQFVGWPDQRSFEREQDRLQRFVARVQRERLKKAG